MVVGVSARTHPGGAHGAVGLRDCGTSGLWDIGTLGLWDYGTPPSARSQICLRGAVQKGAPRRGRGAGLGRLIRRTPRAGQCRRGARQPKAVTM